MSLGLDELTTRAYDLVAAGELVRARAALEDGLAETTPDGDTVVRDLAEAASLYARVLLACGEPAAARDWAIYAHSLAEQLHGADDQRTVRDAATLAAALYRIGDLTESERLYRDVVATLTAQEGPGSPHVLAARADLATVLHATGQCRAARSELATALAAHQAGYGLDEPAGIRMLARLAAMSRDCGDEAAAQRHFTRAKALAETYLPADHPVAVQIAALAAAPANGAHPCQTTPVGQTEDSQDFWPPEQLGDASDPSGSDQPGMSGGGRADSTGGASSGPETRPYGVPSRHAVPTSPGLSGSPGVPGSPGLPHHPPHGGVRRPLSRGHLAAPRRLLAASHLPPVGAPADPSAAAASHPPAAGTDTSPSTDTATNGLGGLRTNGSADADGHSDAAGAPAPPDVAATPSEPFTATPAGFTGFEPGTGYPPPPAAGSDFAGPDFAGPDFAGPDFAGPEPDTQLPGAALAPAYPSSLYPTTDPSDTSSDPTYPQRYLPLRAESSRRRWVLAAFGVGLAVLGVAGGWFAATTLLDDGRSAPPADWAPGTQASPASTGPAAPGGVVLRDGWDSVTLSWTYPSGAEGPVLVAGGRAGEEQRAFHTLPPGSTSYTVHSLAGRADYCFTVSVVYSTDTVAQSAPVCTARGNRSGPPAPSASR